MPRFLFLLAFPLLFLAAGGCTVSEGDDDSAVGGDDDSAGGDDDSTPALDEWGPIADFDWRTPWWDDDPSGDGAELDIQNFRYRTNGRLLEWITVGYGGPDAENDWATLTCYVGGHIMVLDGQGPVLTAYRYDAEGLLEDQWEPQTAYPVVTDEGTGFGAEIPDVSFLDDVSGTTASGCSGWIVADGGYGDFFPDLTAGAYYYYYQPLTFLMGPPAPDLVLDSLVITDDYNGDGFLSAGETVGFAAELTNLGDKESGDGVVAVISMVGNSTAKASLDTDTALVNGGASVGVHESAVTDTPGFQVTVDPSATTDQFISFSVITLYPDGTKAGMGTAFFTIN